MRPQERKAILDSHFSENAIVEVENGFWIVNGPKAYGPDAAHELRNACLHALDRGAEHIAVDLTRVREPSSALLDVLASAEEVLSARGGTLTLWARHGSRPNVVILKIGEKGLETAVDSMRDLGSNCR